MLWIVEIGIILIAFVVYFLADADEQGDLGRLFFLLALGILGDLLNALDFDPQDVVLDRIEVIFAEVLDIGGDEIGGARPPSGWRDR